MSTPHQGRPIVYAEFADYDRATGGYVYNARMLAELAGLGWSTRRLTLPEGFPQPSSAALTQIAAELSAIPDGAIVMIDQVCLARIAALLRRDHALRSGIVEIFHHPTVHDIAPGIPARDQADRLEREALAVADMVIASSRTTARTLTADYAVPASSIVTAPPGFERPAQWPVRNRQRPLRLLSVGAIVPRKGYLRLVEALAGLGQADWRLHIVGNPDRDPDYAAATSALAERLGLGDRVRLLGKLSEEAIEREWAAADLYVSASEHEGFGMAIGEAVMRALPIVTTSAGAVGEWLSPSCASILDGGGSEDLRDAIAALIGEPTRLDAMSRAASEAAAQLPTWSGSARIVSSALAAAFG